MFQLTSTNIIFVSTAQSMLTKSSHQTRKESWVYNFGDWFAVNLGFSVLMPSRIKSRNIIQRCMCSWRKLPWKIVLGNKNSLSSSTQICNRNSCDVVHLGLNSCGPVHLGLVSCGPVPLNQVSCDPVHLGLVSCRTDCLALRRSSSWAISVTSSESSCTSRLSPVTSCSRASSCLPIVSFRQVEEYRKINKTADNDSKKRRSQQANNFGFL